MFEERRFWLRIQNYIHGFKKKPLFVLAVVERLNVVEKPMMLKHYYYFLNKVFFTGSTYINCLRTSGCSEWNLVLLFSPALFFILSRANNEMCNILKH
ncbi:hypothetical protein BpHYR1_010809 [Brachionus plicatilis]|uniref:Uncharacterized protein n=1 Tax=Brachionus plicatilis TaxID=10195 RepID=A0A3M7Q3M7_BRAPC|nr:hypothetical protein BpHYR1_010809 [Brachionus plicatilis]